ncbi:MAG TPA: MBOAT family protein [Candidatus Bathyarchaeia archaeon]|nr:MBOAT family protein [Candidatus Bathyarchaeia archaeon]
MVFSSPIFLFIFLPLVLAGYFAARGRLRNLWLLGMSLVFYGWGEPRFVLIMLVSIAANFGFGLWLDRIRGSRGARGLLAVAVALNLGLLILYKYAAFLAGNANTALGLIGAGPVPLPAFALPLGISFYTFHALSYLVDVSRRAADGQRDAAAMGLYIVFFPQLIAGPIIRYKDIAGQLVQRVVTRETLALGVQRFVIGLGKKMLVANTVAVPADAIFALPAQQLTVGLAWLGIVCYTLQIYFDFSGYSDMAIGLALLFGFRFPENFNYPYVARSMTEFWRRWHISLSTWFRDYVYVPLGGNRLGARRTYLNLWIVFFLCGLWHGAAWTFVAWGLYHGSFLVLERLGAGRWLERLWPPARHVYTMLAVMGGWVLFRAESLGQAGAYLAALAGFASGSGLEQHAALHLNAVVVMALAAGVMGSAPLLPRLGRWRDSITPVNLRLAVEAGRLAGLALLLVASAMLMAAGTYNPFIYFRF